MPALLYTGTVLLYVFTSRRGAGRSGGVEAHPFGKYEIPVIHLGAGWPARVDPVGGLVRVTTAV
jgi:hypothetical protein